MTARCTVRGPVAGKGVSLFTGRPAMFAIRPAPAGAGLTFCRVDLPGKPRIEALVTNISAVPVHPVFAKAPARCTTLASDRATVSTTEHILAALAGMGVHDAEIEVDGPELPIFDGSAGLFAAQIRAMGTACEQAGVEPLVVRETIVVREGAGEIVASPRKEPGCSYTYVLDYGAHPAIPPQSATWTAGVEGAAEEFCREIAPARTFCLEEEARQMAAMGLFGHLDPSEMLVLGRMGPIDNDLRYENEPARHKLLDLVGDLALVGRPIQADIVATKSGHALNHAMAKRLVG